MGRLWKLGDRVRLDVPVIGTVIDVQSGGHTVVEPDGTIDQVGADENYWSAAAINNEEN